MAPSTGATTSVFWERLWRMSGINFVVVSRYATAVRLVLSDPRDPRMEAEVPLEPAQSVTVGPRQALERTELTASGVNWISGVAPGSGARVTARIRHRHLEAAASVDPLAEGRVRVRFDEPQSAVAPGQAVVMYDGDVVVGGGWIE